MSEIWKDIPGHEGRYMVSNLGRVKRTKTSYERIVNSTPQVMRLPERILAQSIAHMYYAVKIAGKTEYVHRLVARAFIGIPGKLEVNHKDGNKLNNNLDNLEYVTHSGNMKHAVHVLKSHKMPIMKGVKNPGAKLNQTKVREIRNRYKPGIVGFHRLAKEYGVSKKLIMLVVQRKAWTHVD